MSNSILSFAISDGVVYSKMRISELVSVGPMSICRQKSYLLRNMTHNNSVDIWCLGILLYELLHGNPPFQANNLSEIKE